MRRLNRKHWIEIGAMTVIFFIAAFLVYKTTILTRMVLPRTKTQVEADDGQFYRLLDGDHIEQTFRYPIDKLLSAGTMIALDEDTLGNLVSNEKDLDLGVLHLEIRNPEGASVMRADYDVYALNDEQNLVASLPGAQEGWAGTDLTLVLDAENIRPEVGLSIGYTTKNVKNTSLTINGEVQDFVFNIQTADHQFLYWKYWAVFGAGMIYLLLLGTYVGLAVFRFKLERMFLFTGSILAVLYLLLLPPLSVPDEEVHLKEAYYYSNQILGKGQEETDKIRMDREDYDALQMFQTTPSLSEYDILKEEISKSGRTEGTKMIKRSDTQAPAVTYIPGILGISLGRMLGLNGLLVFYMGRICSILCYLLTMYWFIRWMPAAKPAAFIIAILPMTLQQCCSYSYDAVVIEFAFLYLAILFGLIYQEQKIKRWQIAWYVVFMVLLSICKGGTYMPLCLLTMLIPASRFSGKKKKWMFVGGMAAVAVTAFLTSTLSYVLYVASPTAEQAADSYLAGNAYGAAGILSEPQTFLYMSVRTLLLSGDGFLETMLGMQLGWLNIFVSRIVIYGLFLLLILSVIRVEGRRDGAQLDVAISQKIAFVIVFALMGAMVFASMFMSWTPKGSSVIAGIQGRYFLPGLPLVLLLFSSKNIALKKEIGRKLGFLAVCLQCLAIYGILASLERVL